MGGAVYWGQENTCPLTFQIQCQPYFLVSPTQAPSGAFPEHLSPSHAHPAVRELFPRALLSHGKGIRQNLVSVLPGVTCMTLHLHGPTCLGTANSACGSRVGRSSSTSAKLHLDTHRQPTCPE